MRAVMTSIVLVASVAAFVVSPESAVRRDRTIRGGATTADGAEVARIRAHFDSVLSELGARDASRLSATQRENRRALVTTLAAYRDRARFPRNYDFPDRLVPYFVDRKTGVRCAVAHLLESTGRADIVQRVAGTNNNVRVPQLAGDTVFTNWLEVSGLTLDEAARIQPSYAEDRSRSRREYAQASAVALTASLGTTALNVTANNDGRYPVVGVLGIVTGAATLGLGALGFVPSDPSETSRGLAFVNGVAGTAGVIIGVRSLARRNRGAAARADARAEHHESPGRDLDATITPTFSVVGERTAGLVLRLRF